MCTCARQTKLDCLTSFLVPQCEYALIDSSYQSNVCTHLRTQCFFFIFITFTNENNNFDKNNTT